MKKQNGKANADKGKARTPGKAAEAARPGKGSGPKSAVPPAAERRPLTMAEYLAMEKVAHSLETALRLRRKYVNAMKGATDMIDRNLDRLREIVWSDNAG